MKKAVSCSVHVYENALFYAYKIFCRAEYVYNTLINFITMPGTKFKYLWDYIKQHVKTYALNVMLLIYAISYSLKINAAE